MEAGWQYKMKITEKTTLAEILKNPTAEKVLLKYNLPCLSCPYAQFEAEELKIGQICQMYKINLKSLLSDLNKL